MNGGAEENRKLQQWVMSLAITVVCCALFFLFFAGYFLRTQEKLIELQVRSEMQEARLNMLENNLLMLGQRVAVPPPPMPAGVVPAPVAQPTLPSAPTPQAPAVPHHGKQGAATPHTIDPMGSGAALLLNTESLTPTVAKPAPPAAKKPAEKDSSAPDAEE